MATKRTARHSSNGRRIPEPPASHVTESDDDPLLDPPEKIYSPLPLDTRTQMRLDQLFAQFPGQSIVTKVYLIRGSEEFFQYAIPNPKPSQVTEDSIRKYRKGLGGRFRLMTFVDDEMLDDRQMLIDDDPSMEIPAVPNGSSGGSHNDIVMVRILDTLTQITTKLSQPQPQSNIVELTTVLKNLRELDSRPQLDFETMFKFINMGKEMAGNGSGETGWMDILKGVAEKAAPALIPAFMGMTPPAPNARPAAAAALPPNPNAPPTEEQQMEIEKAILLQAIAFLKKKANNPGSDPTVYVGVIVDNENESPYDRLIYRINTEEFSYFERLDSELSQPPFFTYFRAIYDGVRSVYSEPNTLDHNSTGAAGNAGNPTGNGGTGTGGSK